MSAPSDAHLLSRIAQRDADAFDYFLSRHRSAVLRHLTRMLRDGATAEDVTQETFLRVWNHAADWGERGSPLSWLLRIATNLALNALRSRSRRREDPWPEGDADREEGELPAREVENSTPGPDEQVERRARWERVGLLLAALSPDHLETMRLVSIRDLTASAAGRSLGIPAGTVRSRLHHARAHLIRGLRAWEEGKEPTP